MSFLQYCCEGQVVSEPLLEASSTARLSGLGSRVDNMCHCENSLYIPLLKCANTSGIRW